MFRIKKRTETAVFQRVPVSVLICAKNEASNLEKNLPQILNQKYYEFQVVVVDDCSTDDTQLVLATMRQKYPELYYTTIPIDNKFQHNKKLAVSVAIKAAKYEHMVFIDADCWPASEHWLSEIMINYNGGKQLILGYGRYEKRPGFLNFFVRFETFWNAVQYFGFAAAVRPFMGVGRNLSYTKQLFNESSRFRNNLHLASGDDDMFVSEVGTRENTGSSYFPNAHTVTEAKSTWVEWVEQKSRHLTTAPFYPTIVKFWLGFEIISRQAVIFLSIYLLIFGNDLTRIIVGSLVFVRLLLMYISLIIAQKRMGERGLWPFAIIMDIIVPWIELVATIYSKLSKKRNTWK